MVKKMKLLCFLLVAAIQLTTYSASAEDSEQSIFYNPALELMFDQLEAYDQFELSKMNKLGADYRVIAIDLAEKQSLTIAQLLTGQLPGFTCESVGSVPTLTVQKRDDDNNPALADLATKWKSLVDSDFVMLALFADIEVLKKSIQKTSNSLIRRNTNCASLSLAIETLDCFQRLESNCHTSYFEQRKKLKAFELLKFGNEVKSLFSNLKPFLALAGEAKIRELIDSSKNYQDISDGLIKTFKSVLKDTIKQYQQWYGSEQIALLLAEQGDWLQKLLGLSPAEIKLIKHLVARNKKQDRALLDYLEGKSTAANEAILKQQSVRELSLYYENNLSKFTALKNKVIAQMRALKDDGKILFKQAKVVTDDIEAAAKQQIEQVKNSAPKILNGNLNETFKVFVDLTPNGRQTAKGRPLQTAKLLLFSTLRQQFINLPACMNDNDNCSNDDVDANPLIKCNKANRTDCNLSNEAGENIDLGVAVDNIIREADGSYSFYCPSGEFGSGSCINSQRTISKQAITKILESIGVPPIVPIVNDAKIFIDSNLENLSYEVDFNPFGSLIDSAPIKLKLIDNGSVVDPKALANSLANQIKINVIEKGLKKWVVSMPFIQDTGEQVDKLFTLVSTNLTELEPTFIYANDALTASIPVGFKFDIPVKLSSSDPQLQSFFGATSYDVTVIINQAGVYIKSEAIPSALYDKLQSAASQYIENLIEPMKVDSNSSLIKLSVNPIFESRFNRLDLSFLVSYGIDAGGCLSVDGEEKISAPFTDIVSKVSGVFNKAKNRILTCASNQLLKNATASLQNQELSLFGITGRVDGAPVFNSELNAAVISVQLHDDQTDTNVNLKNITAKAAGSSFAIDFRTIDWTHDNASSKVGAIIEHRIKSLFVGGTGDKYFTMKNTELSRDGFSFELLIHDLPYLGNFNLGRIYLNAITDEKIIDILKRELKPRMEKAVNHALKENVDIPDLGPITNIQPDISFIGGIQISADAMLQLYRGTAAPIKISLFPNVGVSVPTGKDIAITALTALLTEVVPISVGPIKFKPLPVQVQYFENIGAYGVPFGFVIDVDIVKVEVLGIKITPKKVALPDSISVRLNVPIPIPPFIVIAEPGFTYYLSKKGLTIDGAITIVEQSVSKLVNIDSKIGLLDPDSLTFILKGKLIVASSLPLFEATGTISLKEKKIEYQAGTTQLMKPILDAQGEGALDGANLKAYNSTSIKILGIHIASQDFSINVPASKKIKDGKITFGGTQGMLIGRFGFDMSSDLRFKRPSGTASASIELGGWKAMSGSLGLDLYRAKLNFKALGINIKVIAPSIKSISPRVLLRILADLLKVDIKSLLKMKLDEIVINLMDSDGKVDEENSKKPECETPNCEGSPKPIDPDICCPPVPVPPEPPCTENCDSPISEEEPTRPGYFACYEQMPGRYEFQRIFGSDQGNRGHVARNNHKGTIHETTAWHPVTFGSAEYAQLCSGHKLSNNVWKPVMARQRINYLQYNAYACDSENKMNIDVRPNDGSTWNEYGHGYFCGSATNDKISGFRQVKRFSLSSSIDYDYWLTVDEDEAEFDATEYDKLLKQEFDKVFASLSQVGQPKLDHKNTKLEFVQDGVFCWNCKRKVTLFVHSEPKSVLHHWKQAFHLFYNSGEFWYMSMCEDPSILSPYINVSEPTYKRYCKTTLTKFDTKLSDLGPRVAPLSAAFDKGEVWLEPEEYYFLFEKRAVKHFMGLPMDAKLTDSFDLDKHGIKYKVQMISSGGGTNPPLEYFIYSKQSTVTVKPIIITNASPLYKWMSHPFKKEILGFLMDDVSIKVLKGDIPNNELILLDENSLSDRQSTHVKTTWYSFETIEGAQKVKKAELLIEKISPYRNRALQRKEYLNLVAHHSTEIFQGNWTHLDSGLDSAGKYEITTLSNEKTIGVFLSRLSDLKQLGDLQVSRSNVMKWRNPIAKLKLGFCLNKSSRLDLVKVLTEPEKYYPRLMNTHPFGKLAESRCK